MLDSVSRETILGVGAGGVWVIILMLAAAILKAWPAIRQKINEARQIELEGDHSLRVDLLKRITELENQNGILLAKLQADRIHYDTTLNQERDRCNDALRDLRREMQTNYDGLMRQFITAQMAWAQAIPPHQRSPEINSMLDSLGRVRRKDEE